MDTIDTMQNGDIHQLRNPIAPLTLSESRGLSGGRGRLALARDDSQLYTNENGQLCLMTPVEVIPQEMGERGTPLTFDFEKMSIKYGENTFRFKTAPNVTGSGPISVDNNVIGLNYNDNFILLPTLGDEPTYTLAIKYPISIAGTIGMDTIEPLTFNFQTGAITRAGVQFPISPAPNITSLKLTVVGVGPITIETSSLALYAVNNLIYLSGFIKFSNSTRITLYADVLRLTLPRAPASTIGLTTAFAEAPTTPLTFMLTESDSDNTLSLMATSEIPSNTTILLNFSHIIGTF